MRRPTLVSALVLFLVTGIAFAHGGRHGENISSISFNSKDATAAGCGGLSVRLEGETVPVFTEDVPFHGAALRVRAEEGSGGIRVVGWSGNSYSVAVCKAVAPGVDPGSVRAVLAGNELSATGPADGKWVAYFLVRAPRNASLDLRAATGPISIVNANGTIQAEAVNGPVSVKESSGNITAVTINGPVSVTGGSGRIKLDATNGPVSVKLSETVWDGELDASTRNGPVSVKLPRGFRSGLVVEALGSGPISCKAERCVGQQSMRRVDDRPRRIELGSGPRVVRVSTVNGPVSVKETD